MTDRIIVTGRSCTGCSACYNICPKSAIKMDLADGFYKPSIDKKKCISCKKCVSVCPQNAEIKKSEYTTVAYACKNKDLSVRMKSASGGIFSILAEHTINNGGIVYGVAFDENFMAKHIRINNISELYKLRRSKYLQSYVGKVFEMVKNDLKKGIEVLFSGTPCQCAGLSAYLNQNYNNLTIVEVLCHGVPSPVIWRNYLNYRIKKSKGSSKVLECMFHTKDTSPKARWSNSYMFIRLDNGLYNINSNYDPYMMLFVRSNVILNNSCYECIYRDIIDRGYADISISDFWNIDKIDPEFDDDKGVSFFMIHSEKGYSIFNSCKDKMYCISVDPKKGLSFNSSSTQPERLKMNIKIRASLLKYPERFGKIYYAYLPIIYIRKIIKKINKIFKSNRS